MSANFLIDVVQPHLVMQTEERSLLIRDALRYQLTNAPSPSTSKESGCTQQPLSTTTPEIRRATQDVAIYYVVNNSIYRYIQDTSDVTARLVMNYPGVIDENTSLSFHSSIHPFLFNRQSVAYGNRNKVTLIDLTGSDKIEHMPRHSYRGNYKVLLNKEGIYMLNCLPVIYLRSCGLAPRRQYLPHEYPGSDSKDPVFHLSWSNKIWVYLTPAPLVVSPLVVSHKQYIYILGSQTVLGSYSLVHRYCSATNRWKQCNRFPKSGSSNNAYVLVHDGVISVFTSTTRFKYKKDADTWSADHYEKEDFVKVFVKGNDIRCVTRDVVEEPRLKLFTGQDGDSHCSEAAEWMPSAREQLKKYETKYYLKTYDANINQWVEKQEMNFGGAKPKYFF